MQKWHFSGLEALVIVADKVSKCFSGPGKEVTRAVDEVSFRALPGRVFAVLGPNGSGKTTLLRMLAGLLRPDEGGITVCGHGIPGEVARVRASIGFLTGSAALHKKLTVRETLSLFSELHGLEREWGERRVEELVERLELGDFYGKLVGGLSMGQEQRVMVARTLLHDPAVVIFDEATAGLDVMAAKTLVEMVKECRNEGKTVVFSTHIMGEVARLADDVMVLHRGKVLMDGDFESFREACGGENVEEGFVKLLEGGAVCGG